MAIIAISNRLFHASYFCIFRNETDAADLIDQLMMRANTRVRPHIYGERAYQVHVKINKYRQIGIK